MGAFQVSGRSNNGGLVKRETGAALK